MARGLVEHGARVTIFCAAHDAAPADEVVDGVRYVRRGDHLEVYLLGVWNLLLRRVRQGRPRRRRAERAARSSPASPPASPSSSSCTTCTASSGRSSSPGCSAGSAGGSSAGSRRVLYRRSPVRRGVAGDPRRARRPSAWTSERIAIVHNGTARSAPGRARRSPTPRRIVVRRAAWCRTSRSSTRSTPSSALRDDAPRRAPVGRRAAAGGRTTCASTSPSAGAGDLVTFEGHVTEQRKHEILAQVVADAAALAQGGLGPGHRRGRHAPGADRRLRLSRRHA